MVPSRKCSSVGRWTLAILAFVFSVNCRAQDSSTKHAQTLINGSQPQTVVCLGDSVTGVYYHTGGKRAYPEMLEVAIAQAIPNSQVKVINAGISGNTTADGLARLETDVLKHHPHVVTMSFGLNDQVRIPEDQFRKNLETLIDRCRQAGSQVVLCTPNMVVTTSARPLEKLKIYCDIIRQVGREQKIAVCDQFAAGEAQAANDPWGWRLTLSYEIHPNMDGHKRMAEELCRTLTGHTVSLAAVTPLPDPLATTESRRKSGQPVRVLAMPPFDTLIRPALEQNYPGIKVDVTPWPAAGKTLPELEANANQTVRAMKPDLVIIAVPRSADAESDEQFVKAYSWVMNWSLSFGHAEWDCLVVHPAVSSPSESSPRDDLIRQLVKAQDLYLLDRQSSDGSSPADLLTRWIENHRILK